MMSDLHLPARLDLSAAATLLTRLSEIAAADGECRLFGADVSSVGTACVQTLLAFDKLLEERGRRVALIDPSQVLVDGMRQLGLEDVTNRWMGEE